MTETWQLKQTKQCANCPWRVDSDPHAIDNYSQLQHQALESTIANELGGDRVRAMACHESPEANPTHCIGWLHHQLGCGNNIGLRLSMTSCENASEIAVVGQQHQTFTDTLPDAPKPKFVYFSFAVIDPEFESADENQRVVIVSGSVLGATTEAISRIKRAVTEWLNTEQGQEVLAEVEGVFTVLELEDFYTEELEEILFGHGIIDLQVDIETVTTELNLTDSIH